MVPNLREFLQLAHDYAGQSVAAWWLSEKLDGYRCFWDGGITRGLPKSAVPWANTDKDHIKINTPMASGLWSRYGHAIMAPDWFLDRLPDFPLDGELWMGRGNFQQVSRTVKRIVPGSEWKTVQFKIVDSPSYREVFQDGEIRIKKKYMKLYKGFTDWCYKRTKTREPWALRGGMTFEEKQNVLRTLIPEMLHPQIQLPFNVEAARIQMMEYLASIVEQGGEGLIVRRGGAYWVPKRVHHMLKVKDKKDAEGVVTGYVWGDETDLGSKHLGRMGSIMVEWEGKVFKVAGFKDDERRMCFSVSGNYEDAFKEGVANPKGIVSAAIHNPMFPRGTVITFQYRELTDDGIPKEARYWRIRDEE